MSKRYVITTPIYCPNSVPHVGTALTTIVADITSRYRRMRGENPFFLTGTDENGLKLKEAAESNNLNVAKFVARISSEFRQVWDMLNVRPDDFIRTTEPRHIACVQKFFKLLQDNGYIYLGTYEGWYDVSSETFYKETELVDGKSPDGNEVRWVKEDNYFFKLSAFEEALLSHIESNPDFLIPNVRRNEVLSFIKQGLRDVCISRVNPGWGIPVPGDPERVIYVWFDAVINYLTASGWPAEGWEDKWPADVHWMAKEIFTRFHATLWPAMLMGAKLPLPKHIVGHAYLIFGGEKISKSKGNAIAPKFIVESLVKGCGIPFELAVDALRYGLAAITPFESDANFTLEDFERKYNSDLANDLGNALNRSLAMSHKFIGGVVPDAEIEVEILEAVAKSKGDYEVAMDGFRIDRACDAALELVRFLNKYIDTRAPWALAKNEDPSLASVLKSMLFALRTAEGLVRPIMPTASDAIAAQLGLPPIANFKEIGSLESMPAGTILQTPSPLFPRLDLKAEAQAAMARVLAEKVEAKAARSQNNPKNMSETKSEKPMTSNNDSASATPVSEEITIDDFMKVKLRVARVLEAEPLADSDKLMKLQVVIGEVRRQIIAGIRKSYTPEDLVGRQIVVVANLKPAKLRGADSQGMLLAATDADGSAILLMPDREAPEGASVK